MGMSVGPAGGKGRPPPNVNITPLVDVVLVLLIIFMVMTPLMVKHFGFNLPEKEEGEAPAPSAGSASTVALVLVIKDDGALVLNNKTFPDKEALAAKLKEAFTKRKDNSMFIDASDKVSYGRVAEVMDACRGAGAKSIAFVTEANKNATLQ